MTVENGSERMWGKWVVALGLVVLFTGAVFASVAAAEPAMGYRGAEVSETTVVVGETVNVSARVVNVGSSGGGFTFEFEKDKRDFAERRVTVPAQSDRTVYENISFDSTGTYEITVNDDVAGVITVQPARARVTSDNGSQREVNVRANGVSETEQTAVSVPAANDTLGLERWSVRTGASAFQQNITEFRDPAAAPLELPPAEQSTVLGVLTVESDAGFEDSTMRVGVNDSVVANSSLDSDNVTLYQRNGTAWERLETSLVANESDRVVYEATATRGSAYLVGQLESVNEVRRTSLETVAVTDGQRIKLDAVVRNTGPVNGEFVGTMEVNGEAVNETTVMVPGSDQASLSLSHTVTSAGTYSITVGNTSAGQVIISESQLQNSGSPGGADAASGTGAETNASSDAGGSSVPAAVPPTVLGIDTLYLGGGLGIALLLFVGVFFVLRQSGGGGGGSSNFDEF